jgi:hypothetical protein
MKELFRWEGGKWIPADLSAGSDAATPNVFLKRAFDRIRTLFQRRDPVIADQSLKVSASVTSSVKSGQTQYFKMSVDVPYGLNGEFFLEAVGDRGGYGFLDPWFAANWTYRKQLTIDYTMVSSTSDLTNFPALVAYTDTDLKSSSNGGHAATSTGYDIMFTSIDGSTKLNHEIESYSSSTGAIVMWVQIPTLSCTTNTAFYIYYGNNNVTSTQENVSSTWDGSFRSVWHLKETSGVIAFDSTTVTNNGTMRNTPTKGVTGEIGNAITLNGTNQAIEFSTTTVALAGDITVEGWGKIASAAASTTYMGFMGKLVTTYSGYALIMYYAASPTGLNNTFRYMSGGGSYSWPLSNKAYVDTNWHHVVGVRTGTTNNLYVDGVLQTSSTKSTFADSAAFGALGRQYENNSTARYWNGTIDEMRLSVGARSYGWIATEYKNATNQGTGTGKFIKILASEETGSAFTQSAYRWFDASATTAAGNKLTDAKDTEATLTSASQQFRLRMLLHVATANLYNNAGAFRLQYVGMGNGTCASPSNGTPSTWTDVTGTTAIAYYDNAGISDNTALAASSTADPTDGGDSISNQTYEEANNFTNSVAVVNATQDGKWDFSLVVNGAPGGTTYCFRAVSSSTQDSYTVYPKITTYTAVSTVSCSTNVVSTAFTALSSAAISVSSPAATTTMSCSNTGSGCALYVKDAGGGGNPGLWNSTSSAIIPSPNAAYNPTALLAAGTEGYGILAATSTAGSGAAFIIAARYYSTSTSSNTVGGLSLSNIAVASSSADATSREVGVTHKAAIGTATPSGSYTDTITYSCTVN